MRPSQFGRYRVQKCGRMDSLNTFLTFSGVTSKHFWISLVLMFSSCIFSWFLQTSVNAILSLQRMLCSQIFQKAIAAMVFILTSNSAAFTIRSHISIMARSSSILILRFLQTLMMTCLGFMIGTKSILNLRTMFISLMRSFQSLRESPITLEILNSSKQFSFQKQAEYMAYPAMFLIDKMFLCFSRFSFFRYYESSSPNSSPFSRLSFSLFSWFMILRMVRYLAVATSLMFWFSLSTKQQSAMIFLPFLKDLSKLASFSSSIPPLSSVLEQSVVNLFQRRSSPSQCITSLSQLIGWTSTKVHQRMPHTLAPFSKRTE